MNSPVRFKLVIWKLSPCFQHLGWLQPTNSKLPRQPTLLVSIQTSFFKISTNGLLSLIYLFFVFKIYSQSFLTFYCYWCLEVGPESIYCLVLIKTGLPRAREKITNGGQHCQHWNLIKRKSFPLVKNQVWTRILKFLQLHYFFVLFAHNSWIQIIFSKPCHMLDKRRLGNSGETYHIIESVLVVVAFQISPSIPSYFPLD